MLHPQWAARSCHDCQTYEYGSDLKVICRPAMSNNRLKRSRGGFPGCEGCPKVPKGDPPFPSSAQELSKRNTRALIHWRECRSVNSFPDDPIVRRNAAIIQDVYDEINRQPLMDLALMLPILSKQK